MVQIRIRHGGTCCGVKFLSTCKALYFSDILRIDAGARHNDYSPCSLFYKPRNQFRSCQCLWLLPRCQYSVAPQFNYLFQSQLRVDTNVEGPMKGHAYPARSFDHTAAIVYVNAAIWGQCSYDDAVDAGRTAKLYV